MNDFDQNAACDQPATEALSSIDSCPSQARQRNKLLRLPSTLRADCSRCTGLCCVVHAFYAVQGFAFDKEAYTECRYLTSTSRCAIHPELASRGFPGCVAFDCYGAGQRVTQELCNGVAWRSSREMQGQIFSAYTCFLALHRLMAMLMLAESITPPPLGDPMRRKRQQLDELCRSEGAKRGNIDISSLQREVLELIRGIARVS